jgi:signal transduction histidine kinase
VNSESSKAIPDIQVKNHPFPVLLYLEWGLLVLGMLSILFIPSPFIKISQSVSRLPIALILVFGLFGLRLPVNNIRAIVHTLLSLALILLTTFVGMHNRLFPFLHLYPYLYIILVIRACLMFRFRGRLWATVSAFGLFLLVLIRRVRNSNWAENIGLRIPVEFRDRIQDRLELLNIGVAFTAALLLGLALLFIFLLVNALLSERHSREQLRQYALRVESLAMEQERNRIAREIHDSLGHSLTALNLQLEGAIKLWQVNPERAQTFLREAKQMGSIALQEIRQSVSAMRADPLRGRRLEEAIASLIQDFYRSTGIQPACHIDLPAPLAAEMNVAVYRIIQEALTNISKHASAKQVTIEMNGRNSKLHLVITDDGQGFERSQNQTGFGLQGMQERVLAMGGALTIESSIGQGCRIRVAL